MIVIEALARERPIDDSYNLLRTTIKPLSFSHEICDHRLIVYFSEKPDHFFNDIFWRDYV